LIAISRSFSLMLFAMVAFAISCNPSLDRGLPTTHLVPNHRSGNLHSGVANGSKARNFVKGASPSLDRNDVVVAKAILQDSQKVEWVTRRMEAPRVSYYTFESKAAHAKVSYHLYTPRAYNETSALRLPVVYWLHGSGGGLAGIPQLASHFDQAIEAGQTPPCLVVFVNGLVNGMYVDWKDGTVPLETVIVEDLISHIDSSHRTIATRFGRLLDGFSMGGYGAARLGFKFPEKFRAVSVMGAGPLQEELKQTPRVNRRQADALLTRVYGGDQGYFRVSSPRKISADNASTIAKDSLIRLVVGDADETYENNLRFHEHLEKLKIPHTWTVLSGIAHDPMAVLRSTGDEYWKFYRTAFGKNKN
jgi:enterochelin esterase-like enzyme